MNYRLFDENVDMWALYWFTRKGAPKKTNRHHLSATENSRKSLLCCGIITVTWLDEYHVFLAALFLPPHFLLSESQRK